MEVSLSEDKMYETLSQVICDYDACQDNLIQVLHMAQVIFGSIPLEVQKFIAQEMDMPFSEVSGAVPFYYEEFLGKPLGHRSHELLHTTYTKRSKY